MESFIVTHYHENAVFKSGVQRGSNNIRSITFLGSNIGYFYQLMLKRIGFGSFPAEDLEAVGSLIRHQDITRFIRQFVDRDTFMIGCKTSSAKYGQLFVAFLRVGIVLAYTYLLIRVINITQLIIHRYRFN